MQSTRTCPRCHTLYSPEVATCPRCVLEVALGAHRATGADAAEDNASDSPSPRPEPPTLDEITRAFPEFDGFELLGRGGMGVVYKARQKKLERLVALKILPREFGLNPNLRERFLREARALARLVHPNIVAVHDFGESDGLCFLLLELVDGTNLREVLRRGPMAPREALAVVRSLCDALQYAHDEGVVHRDIKPENVLLDRSGRVKVADFGLAKVTGSDASAHLTAVGQVMGTPHYMAPEQIDHPRDVDSRADLFALGVVMYEMLTGTLPRGSFELPSQRMQVDVRLDEVVLKALERDPTRRYQHAIEVKTDVVGIEATPTRTEPATPRSAQAPRRAGAVGSSFLRGVSGFAVCVALWVVVAVCWNLGPFALGLSCVAVIAVAAALLRDAVSTNPALGEELADAKSTGMTHRIAGASALALAALALLFVGHFAYWERGTEMWSPSFTDLEQLRAAALPGQGAQVTVHEGPSLAPSTVRTRFESVGTASLADTIASVPPVTAFSGAVVLAVLAAYVAIRPHSRPHRRAAWRIAGSVSARVGAGLACVWVACWLGAQSEKTMLGDIYTLADYEIPLSRARDVIQKSLIDAGMHIELEDHVSTEGESDGSRSRGMILCAAAPSPFDRWKMSLKGARRDSPQVWAKLDEMPGGKSIHAHITLGRYHVESVETAKPRDLLMGMDFLLR